MLTHEEATIRLRSVADDDWQNSTDKRTSKLARSDREHARVVAGTADEIRYDQRRARIRALGKHLDELRPKRLSSMMSALHPEMGAALTRWWEVAKSQPYQSGWERRAFRAPNHSYLTRESRTEVLIMLVHAMGPYRQGPKWFADWAGHVAPAVLGPVLAVAIDDGGDIGQAVFESLIEQGTGDHAIGTFGNHVIHGLLRSSRQEGWTLIEQTLLAAQRQEGLRQSILEAIDEAHPDAFVRILRTVVDQKLLRFAATIRAVGVWLGCPLEAQKLPLATRLLEQFCEFLEDPSSAEGVLRTSDDAVAVYIAAMSLGMVDVVRAVAIAGARISDDASASPKTRIALGLFLSRVGLTSVHSVLSPLLLDPDLDLAVIALQQIVSGRWNRSGLDPRPELVTPLRSIAGRLPKKRAARGPLLFEGLSISMSASEALQAAMREAETLDEFIEDLPLMDADARRHFVVSAGSKPSVSGAVRSALVGLAGDASSSVRENVAHELTPLEPGEAQSIEKLLTRSATTTRKVMLSLLESLEPTLRVESAQRLWVTGNAQQRNAACELLSTCADDDAARSLANAVAPEGTDEQVALLGGMVEGHSVESPFSRFLASLTCSKRHQPDPPKRVPLLATTAACHLLETLDAFAETHRNVEVTVSNWQGERNKLLADVKYLPGPFRPRQEAEPTILADELDEWWSLHRDEVRDSDGRELIRSILLFRHVQRRNQMNQWAVSQRELTWADRISDSMIAPGDVVPLTHPAFVQYALETRLASELRNEDVEFALGAYEHVLGSISRAEIDKIFVPTADDRNHWQHDDIRREVNQIETDAFLMSLLVTRPDVFTPSSLERWFSAAWWLVLPKSGVDRHQISEALLAAARRSGCVGDGDLAEHFARGPHALTGLTKRRPLGPFAAIPDVVDLADRLRTVIVETEVDRGDLATDASPAALGIASIEGVEVMTKLVSRLGSLALARGYQWGDDKRGGLSRLIRVSYPGADEDAPLLAAAAEQRGIKDKRLLEVAIYAPQWADLIEQTLGWTGLADAIWWIHAHTKDEQWSVEPEVRATWSALSAERTGLSSADLVDGAVDVDWFWRMYATLGSERWADLYKAAKNGSSGTGHRRAQTFADALLGVTSSEIFETKIGDKRNKDAVRALGLAPLPKAATKRRSTMLARYATLTEFGRSASKFGSQRQASERLAMRIGIENLARTGGFADPQQFMWAMEAEAVADLAVGPVVVTVDDVSVALSIDDDGVPQLDVDRAGKSLKSVPAKLRKHVEIATLRERKTALTRQVTRIRASLEAAMVRGDRFAAGDLRDLDRHPMVAAMLGRLVLIDDEGLLLRRVDTKWVDVAGDVCSMKGSVRIAHAADLHASKTWEAWQRCVIAGEIAQPFKQVFREFYTPTDAERSGEPFSRRYEGHQVQPRQAVALFGARGWLGDPDSGVVSRTFHHAEITARVDFLDGFMTVAEVEPPTIGRVTFTRRSSFKALPLASVPPVVFSEAFRDLDLVVSVAHVGGVDPEATASTVEMRAALVAETMLVLGHANVEIIGSHVVIEGVLGEYSVHLGSGVVHRRPGGQVCVVPVHAQRRGRIFLPFADDDPKTAEVVSKVLLFADDRSIKDPSILSQLR